MKTMSIIPHIVRKEFIQTFRDKRMLLPIFVAPVIQLVLFGFAMTTDIKNIPMAVVDYDRSTESRRLLSSFSQSDYFHLNYHLWGYHEIEILLQKGKIKAAAIIPQNFEKDLHGGAKTSIQIILDGTDANSAAIILSYISRLVAQHSENLFVGIQGNLPAGLINPQPRIWYNPELKSSAYMVPGVICLILLLTTLILTSMAITREKEMGTIEQLLVSPIKSWELILGKTVPFVLIGLGDIILIIAAGKLIFDLPVRGSLLLLFAVALVFILTTLSLGLFISTISRTQQQAMMTAFFFVMPAMLLSGIFTPIESMPPLVQHITFLNPLRYFSHAVRGILLKGNDLAVLWPQILILFLFGLTAIILSSLRFKKYLE